MRKAETPIAREVGTDVRRGMDVMALSALPFGATARVEAIADSSLGVLLARLGLRPGMMVRPQSSPASTIAAVSIGSRTILLPRAWTRAVLVTALERPTRPAAAAESPVRHRDGKLPVSRDERIFASAAGQMLR